MTKNKYITPERLSDPQYGAAIRLFNAVGRGHAYVEKFGIDKERLLSDSRKWSTGEQIVVKVALDIFEPGCVTAYGYVPANVGEIVGTLDSRLYPAVVDAMAFARRGR